PAEASRADRASEYRERIGTGADQRDLDTVAEIEPRTFSHARVAGSCAAAYRAGRLGHGRRRRDGRLDGNSKLDPLDDRPRLRDGRIAPAQDRRARGGVEDAGGLRPKHVGALHDPRLADRDRELDPALKAALRGVRGILGLHLDQW